jgi:hypothetical protein
VNRFIEWIGLKQKLHHAERDLWWAPLEQNASSEVKGESDRLFEAGSYFAKVGA